mgnify:CR=1 FL=1
MQGEWVGRRGVVDVWRCVVTVGLVGWTVLRASPLASSRSHSQSPQIPRVAGVLAGRARMFWLAPSCSVRHQADPRRRRLVRRVLRCCVLCPRPQAESSRRRPRRPHTRRSRPTRLGGASRASVPLAPTELYFILFQNRRVARDESVTALPNRRHVTRAPCCARTAARRAAWRVHRMRVASRVEDVHCPRAPLAHVSLLLPSFETCTRAPTAARPLANAILCLSPSRPSIITARPPRAPPPAPPSTPPVAPPRRAAASARPPPRLARTT